MKQTSTNEVVKKELREKACMELANWFYDAGLAFNAANYSSFMTAMELVAWCGSGFNPPSYHEIRVPFLTKAVKSTQEMVTEIHQPQWAKYGCTIMSDGWRDSVVQKDIINFLVNSPKGSIFIKSIDASDVVKNAEQLFMMLDEMVEEVGEENVVQVVTDNASAYVAVGRLLMAKRPHLYWTPCVAHCIDLMLEDNGKIPKVRTTLQRAMALNGYIYIYNRVGVVNLMRKFTGKRELVRPAVTRFATAYITLRSIQVQKENLRKMFTSDEWRLSKYSQEQGAKRVASFVLMPTFWSSIVWILKMTGPLVKVLRLVDGEKKPAMGYIYEAMDRAKEAIAKSFNNIEDKNGEGIFGMDLCIQHRDTKSPADWWGSFGNGAPQLKKFVIRVLSLTCSATGCERNWSIFGHLHSKRRNRLEQGRLNCLVYVKYNRALKERYDHRDVIDPISLNNIDDSNEWLVGRMYEDEQEDEDYVFDDNDLMWKDVGKASGAYEREHNTRRKNVKASSSGKKKGKVAAQSTPRLIDEDEEDEVVIIEKSDTEEEDIGDDETEEEGEDDFALSDDDEFDE
ncbi:hypothetical protein OSB04_016946 [Centaurea solstitialis]|uniref:DUF659 domain-containing protein n=1 Tax=Centaurea solstitialis TaxID=347529 RepID=A0AA38TF61_9ASTR|nr:hypothetical protein OSB04_016946 [Centaurea solstitialis]